MNKSASILILSSLLFGGGTVFAQKIYLGLGYRAWGLNTIFTNYEYLSDSPYTFLPYKIEKQNQLNPDTMGERGEDILYLASFEAIFGVQRKRHFFEFTSQPFATREITLKTIRPENYFSSGTEKFVVNTTIRTFNMFLNYKYNLSGRKKFRINATLGLGTMFVTNYFMGKKDAGAEFFGIEKSAYFLARGGIEFYLTSFTGFEMRYTQQSNGYIEFLVKFHAYTAAVNNKIYLGE